MKAIVNCLQAAIAACFFAGSVASAAPPGPPIVVGSISTLSGGPAVFASTGQAAKAFFDSVNASGGIQNRKIVYLQEDDKADPAVARQMAAKLLDETKVVALTGGASLLECAVNAARYSEAGVVSVPGLGLDKGCFTSQAIAPVNSGAFVQMALAMRYASERLRAERLCVMRLGNPINLQKEFDAVVQDWTLRSGRTPALDERNIQYSDKPEELMAKAILAKCQAVVFGGSEPFVLAFARAAQKRLDKNVALLFIGSAYTSRVAQELGSGEHRIFAMSEFEPWSSRSGSLSNWRNLMTTRGIPLTSASQGGYVSAQVLVQVLSSIKGEINRQSVTEAYRQLKPINVAMAGMPFTFGTAMQHHPNQAAIPVELLGGRWRIAHHEWLIYTPASPSLAARAP